MSTPPQSIPLLRAASLLGCALLSASAPIALRAQVAAPPPAPRPADQVVVPVWRDETRLAVPKGVADAEAEGRTWERTSGPSTQVATLRALFAPRIAAPSCVQVSGAGPVRSGDFRVTGQLRGAVGVRKIRWSPSHPTTSYFVTGRMRRLDGVGVEARFLSGNLVHQSATGEFGFETDFVWPGAGRWLVVVTSGPDWGCFLFG